MTNMYDTPPSRIDDTDDMANTLLTPASEIAFVRCVERLEEMIDAETRILKSCSRVDFEALNLRKTHALVEFTRVAQNTPLQTSELARRKLSRLSERLSVNSEALEQHLRAMQEIVSLIVDCIRDDDSDGTYSRKGAPRR